MAHTCLGARPQGGDPHVRRSTKRDSPNDCQRAGRGDARGPAFWRCCTAGKRRPLPALRSSVYTSKGCPGSEAFDDGRRTRLAGSRYRCGQQSDSAAPAGFGRTTRRSETPTQVELPETLRSRLGRANRDRWEYASSGRPTTVPAPTPRCTPVRWGNSGRSRRERCRRSRWDRRRRLSRDTTAHRHRVRCSGP